MTQASDLWNLDHVAKRGRRYRSADRRIFLERQMRTVGVNPRFVGNPYLIALRQSCPPLGNNPPKFEGALQTGLADYTSIERRVMRGTRLVDSYAEIGLRAEH